MSISGGVYRAFARGAAAGCTTMQVFTKNASRWSAPPYTPGEIDRYRLEAEASPIVPVLAHAAYLINLCSTSRSVLARSREALRDELHRCAQLGIFGLILHPGSHGGVGEGEGMRRIADSLNEVHRLAPAEGTLTVLETTAGQGNTVGYRFDQLRGIIDLVEEKARMAVCLDTCHVFAAGYDIRTPQGWERMMEEFDTTLGLGRLAAVHVNDSRRELGSRVDRHEHIGRGRIGLEGFRSLMNDVRLERVPKVLETEKSEDLHEDIENMRALRALVAQED